MAPLHRVDGHVWLGLGNRSLVFHDADVWVLHGCRISLQITKACHWLSVTAKIDFFQRQVLTSRNIRGSWLTDNLMGGLNYQVEHHLFPSMARPNLRQEHTRLSLSIAVRMQIPLVEMNLLSSYMVIMRYLNDVGLSKNSDPFVCPMVATLRPRN